MSDDYSGYIDNAASTGSSVDLSQLQDLAEKQIAAEDKVAKAQLALEDAQKELKQLAEVTIPELMELIGIDEFKTRNGLKIAVEEVIRASIPKPRAPEAFAWLRAHDHGALIKRKVTVEFGKGEDEKAAQLAAELRSKDYSVDDKADVHSQTLGSFVREKLRAGIDIPLDLFGVFRQRVSKIKT